MIRTDLSEIEEFSKTRGFTSASFFLLCGFVLLSSGCGSQLEEKAVDRFGPLQLGMSKSAAVAALPGARPNSYGGISAKTPLGDWTVLINSDGYVDRFRVDGIDEHNWLKLTRTITGLGDPVFFAMNPNEKPTRNGFVVGPPKILEVADPTAVNPIENLWRQRAVFSKGGVVVSVSCEPLLEDESELKRWSSAVHKKRRSTFIGKRCKQGTSSFVFTDTRSSSTPNKTNY